MQAAEEPDHEQYHQHEAKNAAEPTPSIAIVSIVAPAAAEQQDQHNNDQDCAHFSPSLPREHTLRGLLRFGFRVRLFDRFNAGEQG
jgi:hypothetical protein